MSNLSRGAWCQTGLCGTLGTLVVLAISVKSRIDNLNSPVFSSNLVLIAKGHQNIINVYISTLESKLISSSERPLSFLPVCIVTNYEYKIHCY